MIEKAVRESAALEFRGKKGKNTKISLDAVQKDERKSGEKGK